LIYKQEIELLQTDPYDILIVGGGAVGLSLATSLAYDNFSICVVESGLERQDFRFDKLKFVESFGLNIKPSSRERILGGCGQTWNGKLANFDLCDFTHRGTNYPALGIDQNEIQALLNKFGKFFKIPDSSYFDLSKYPKSRFDLGDPFEQKVFLQQYPVFKFGDRLKHVFDRPGVDLILGWTVSNLDCQGSSCKGVTIFNMKAEYKFLYSKRVVLCCGAIENIRLLQFLQKQGKISTTLPIGERFMNHPKGIVCKIKLNEPVSVEDSVFQFSDKESSGFTGHIGFRFTDTYVTENKLSNTSFEFSFGENFFENVSSFNLIKIAREFPGIAKPQVFRWFAKLIFSLWKFRDGLLGIIYKIFLGIIQNFSFNKVRQLKVKVFAEMSSQKENNVSLVSGMKAEDPMVPRVAHGLSFNDLHSIDRLIEKLREILDQKKIGKIILSKKNLRELVCTDASHHIGGTRISLSGDDGVVSSEFKVIGTENLYVCGGSVLRSSGHANPTMIFIGMALKLAKYLRSQIGFSRINKSFFELDFEKKIIQPEIIIIGAGKRVREDVLPVFESLTKNQAAIALYAKNESGIFGRHQPRTVKSINDFSSCDVSKTRIIYVAVPVNEAIFVAKKLKQTLPEKVKVIWDTPICETVLYALNILKNHQKFVAEDSSYLPWLELLERKEGSVLDRILIDGGGFLYHATTFASEIQKRINGNECSQKFNIKKSSTALSYNINGKVKVIIKLARSYEEGSIKLFFDDESKITLGGEGGNSSVKIIRNKIGQCSGFSLGNKFHALSEEETDLIGYVCSEDDIVSIMLKIKRVGLRRLILDVFNNKKRLKIIEANFDAGLFLNKKNKSLLLK
jgi:hypothetical protein